MSHNGAVGTEHDLTDQEVDHVNAISSKSGYWSVDLAPVPPSKRKWGMRDMIALWVALSACIPTYMLASSLIGEGMNWLQAVLTIFLGNLIVLIPMVLNAHAGTKYGIPFPVLCRASFGIRGANVPAMLRALVACGWFGIQCSIGGSAIYKVIAIYLPYWETLPNHSWLGINTPQLVCFTAFWLVNLAIIWRGIEWIRLLLNIKAPLLIGLGLALLYWAYREANGFGPMLSQPSKFSSEGEKAGQFWSFFFPALTANVGFWATLSLNIPDFTRYVRTQRDQVLGQAIGLPLTMGLYSFIGVAVTSATVVIYGVPVWDPVDLLAKFSNPWWQILGLVGLVIATLATNLAANVIGPANDFANLSPRNISFRMGVVITGSIGILIQPWRLVEDPTGYIFTWLVAYSSLLGAVGGVMICDYFLNRRMRLELDALYRPDGPYWYSGGFHIAGLVALLLGVLPCVPGFLSAIGAVKVAPIWNDLYHYTWFISFGISFSVYLLSILVNRRISST